jgi:uncharacterized membrane protein (UPF0136 family)
VVSTSDHPDLAAPSSSCSVGALYFYSGDSIRKHTANGLETALGEYLLVFKPREMLNPNDPLPGASAVLFLSSVPRFAKGPIPAMLTVTSAAAGAYYGRAIYKLNQ